MSIEHILLRVDMILKDVEQLKYKIYKLEREIQDMKKEEDK